MPKLAETWSNFDQNSIFFIQFSSTFVSEKQKNPFVFYKMQNITRNILLEWLCLLFLLFLMKIFFSANFFEDFEKLSHKKAIKTIEGVKKSKIMLEIRPKMTEIWEKLAEIYKISEAFGRNYVKLSWQHWTFLQLTFQWFQSQTESLWFQSWFSDCRNMCEAQCEVLSLRFLEKYYDKGPAFINCLWKSNKNSSI